MSRTKRQKHRDKTARRPSDRESREGETGPVPEPEKIKEESKSKRELRSIPPKSLTAIVLVIGIIIVAMAGIQGSKFGKTVTLGLGPEWFGAVAWIKNNTDQSEVVASWWDYGYWIETYANRTTLADGATIKDLQIKALAKAFLGTQETMNQLCEEYDVSLVVIDVAQDVVQGKWGAMAYIANVNANNYVVQDPETKTMELLPPGQAAPIFRMASPVLMTETLPMANMTLRWWSSTRQVVIYSYDPHWSNPNNATIPV